MNRILSLTLGLCLAAQGAEAQGFGGKRPINHWNANCYLESGRDCTVSAKIDSDGLLGTFVIVRYSAAHTTLAVVVEGIGRRASIQIDQWPFVSTSICTGNTCAYEPIRSAELLQAMLRGSRMVVLVSLQGDTITGPLQMTLSGFTQQYQKAVQVQQGD